MAFVIFVIGVFARRIVGWFDAHRPGAGCLGIIAVVEYRCRGADPLQRPGYTASPDLYTECLASAGLESSAGSTGGSYANVVAETIIGLFKAGVIWR